MLSLPIASLYVCVVGFKPSLTRALLLLSMRPLQRTVALPLLLAGAYVLQLFLFPWTIDSAGMVLSYGSLLAILACSRSLSGMFSTVLPLVVSAPLAASVSASVCLAPLSVFLFGAWYPVGILLSLCIVPITAVFLVCLCAWLVFPVGPLCWILRLLAFLFELTVRWGSRWSLQHPSLSTIGAWWCILVSLLTVMGLLRYAGRATMKKNRQAYDVGFSLRFTKRDT